MTGARALALALVLTVGEIAHAAGPMVITVISKSATGPFWRNVMQGALKASRDYGVVVTFEGPGNETGAGGQVDLLAAALAKNPSAVCIDALDSGAVLPLLETAKARKIPVIGFDSGKAQTEAIRASAIAGARDDRRRVPLVRQDQHRRPGDRGAASSVKATRRSPSRMTPESRWSS